jgi:hypothetical protein
MPKIPQNVTRRTDRMVTVKPFEKLGKLSASAGQKAKFNLQIPKGRAFPPAINIFHFAIFIFQ